MTQTNRLKVFLCHAHSDATAVRDLYRYLHNEGVDAWLDKESLLPGADWDLEIRKAVRASDVVVVCLSKEFNKVGYRQKEVRLALETAMEKLDGEIFIIPAHLEECETPENLSKWHRVDLFEEGGRKKLIKALRVRADSTGASLRRRRRQQSGATQPQNAKTGSADDDAISMPTHSDSAVDAVRKVMFGHNLTRKQEQARVPSGIWIGADQNVWRDETNLGKLTDSSQYKVLSYLIGHKNEFCPFEALYKAAFGKDDYIHDVFEHIEAIEIIIRQLRGLIEINDRESKHILGIKHSGYMLKE
jgi:DNA-binding response OmpR family regulator